MLDGYGEKERLENAFHLNQAIEVVLPRATGRELLTFFQNRTTKQKICDWRKGRRWPPAWAVDLLRRAILTKVDRDRDLVRRALEAPERPGRKAGAINLARWKAHRWDKSEAS